MNSNELIRAISVKDVDIDPFVQLTLCDEESRDEIIDLLINHPDIMVYYHCYYVVGKASQDRPDLFIGYWDKFVSLLQHKNSYHRNIALTIIANLTQADHENRFSDIFQAYFEHIHDVKFMTGQCCVRNSLRIMINKPELKHQIIALLLNFDHQSAYPDKQKALFRYDVLEILDEVYNEINDKNDLNEFIGACVTSISPKTRHKAMDLKVKYGL